MDTQYVWKEEFNIGVASIDQEHQELFESINKLFFFTAQKKGGWAGGKNSRRSCRKGIALFKEHALKHFADEEAYMESIDYDGIMQHKRIHKAFRENTIPALERELEQTNYSPEAVEHFLGVCAGWLIGHTTSEDQAITGKGVRTWENLLPGEELADLKKVAEQLVYNIFSLKAKLISDVYNGEKFGNGLYYRLVYETKETGKKQEVLLAFEERLLVGTIGDVMGKKRSGKLDTAMLHAARHTMQRFSGRMMEYFLKGSSYKLKEESLLSYAQFQAVFETEMPVASLLFDTGEGYLASCILTPRTAKEPEVGTPINAENALNEVEKYLTEFKEQEQAAPRKKILLVDDSITVRQMLYELLSGDYEVEMVDSGVAAIRAVALNKPDLVLLDYDMPICNGKQTLELLRSEEFSKDVPVIFLTSRSDSDTVTGVLSLKPSGYMLKSLRQPEIKKRVDEFFAS